MASYQWKCVYSYTALTFIVLALFGCKSTPSTPSAPTKSIPRALSHLPSDAQVYGINIVDIQLALADRNLYQADNGHIKMLATDKCPLDVSAHRGDFRFPESSRSAITAALSDNYDSVEIDVMQLKDGTWVNHHDSQTGRATVYYTGERFKLKKMSQQQYANLKLRDKKSNDLINRRPITAYEAFRTFADYRQRNQQLNVEIKSDANGHDLAQLDTMLKQTVGTGNYYFSADNLGTLEKLRGINSQVYLGFVQQGHPNSVEQLRADLREGVKGDDYYRRHQTAIEFVGEYGSRRYRAKYNNYANYKGIQALINAVGVNSGLHLDIRNYVENPKVLRRAHEFGMKIYTYSLNGTEYHQSQLRRLTRATLPDGVIVDTTPYQICQILFQNAVPKNQYHPLSIVGKYIASLPIDADFDRFNEMLGYQTEGYYISLSSGLKAITPTNSKVTTPVKPITSAPLHKKQKAASTDPYGFPVIIDESVNHSETKSIIITLPNNPT